MYYLQQKQSSAKICLHDYILYTLDPNTCSYWLVFEKCVRCRDAETQRCRDAEMHLRRGEVSGGHPQDSPSVLPFLLYHPAPPFSAPSSLPTCPPPPPPPSSLSPPLSPPLPPLPSPSVCVCVCVRGAYLASQGHHFCGRVVRCVCPPCQISPSLCQECVVLTGAPLRQGRCSPSWHAGGA